MTGTIDDASPVPEGASQPYSASQPHSGHGPDPRTTAAALVEQAKGVLIFRYAVSADAAFSLLELWAAETNVAIDAVARAVVHDICQGDRTGPSDPHLVRWLEDRLRHEYPGLGYASAGGQAPVCVAVNHPDSSLDVVVDAAREANRRGVPLEVTIDRVSPDDSDIERAQLMQRIDLAVELARAVAPGIDVRLPLDNPFEPDPEA
jgi:hypothetical protein